MNKHDAMPSHHDHLGQSHRHHHRGSHHQGDSHHLQQSHHGGSHHQHHRGYIQWDLRKVPSGVCKSICEIRSAAQAHDNTPLQAKTPRH